MKLLFRMSLFLNSFLMKLLFGMSLFELYSHEVALAGSLVAGLGMRMFERNCRPALECLIEH